MSKPSVDAISKPSDEAGISRAPGVGGVSAGGASKNIVSTGDAGMGGAGTGDVNAGAAGLSGMNAGESNSGGANAFETHLFPECETVVTTYGKDFLHCGYTVEQLGRIDLNPFTPLTGGELFEPGNLLFLDTETTGLSGGAGTVAFLLGVGHFCENGFIIKQYLMRDYDEEQSLLNNLIAEMNSRPALVSYNGKAFDLNLLESRCVMNAMRLPKAAYHIDLLHPARRIWRRCLENCRLVTIENEILGEHREEDIPGSLIPQVYFEYLETRETEAIQKVLLHNRLDVLAMAAILKYVSDLISRTRQGFPYETASYNIALGMSSGRLADRTAEELLGLAGFFCALRDGDLAESCLLKCLERNKPAVTRRAMMIMAEMKKREGKYAEAAKYWNSLLAFSPAVGIYPYIELSKYYEHRARDPAKAKEYADQAQLLASGPVFRNTGATLEIETRRERLKRKIDHLAECSTKK